MLQYAGLTDKPPTIAQSQTRESRSTACRRSLLTHSLHTANSFYGLNVGMWFYFILVMS